DGRVDVRGEHRGSEDAGEVEPLAAHPDPLPGVDAIDAEQLSAGGADYGDGFLRGGGVEVMAVGEGRGDDREEVEGCRLNGQAVGVDRWDEAVTECAHAGDFPCALHL